MKAEKHKNSSIKKRNKESRALISEGTETINRLLLDEDEIENIFDILEKEETSI